KKETNIHDLQACIMDSAKRITWQASFKETGEGLWLFNACAQALYSSNKALEAGTGQCLISGASRVHVSMMVDCAKSNAKCQPALVQRICRMRSCAKREAESVAKAPSV